MTLSPVFTLEDICEQISQIRPLEVKRFYEWMPFCLIPETKALYSLRDLKKFLFVGASLNLKKNFENAKQSLVTDLAVNRTLYGDNIYVEQFINQHPVIKAGRNKRFSLDARRVGDAERKRGRGLRTIHQIEEIEVEVRAAG